MNLERITETISELKTMYDSEFGGKPRGRFKIARDHMLYLLGVVRLYDDDAQFLVNEAFKQGVVVINADAYFHVIMWSDIVNWRPAPKKLIY